MSPPGPSIGELKAEIGAVRAELRTLTWLTGLTLVVVLAMAARVFGVVQASHARSAAPGRRLRRRRGMGTAGGRLDSVRRRA